MIEISLAKFLYDYVVFHDDKNGEFKIKDLNNCIEKLEYMGVCIDFSQSSTSSLINKCNGSLKWENGMIICDVMFRMTVIPYVIGNDYFNSNEDLEKEYYKIIGEN